MQCVPFFHYVLFADDTTIVSSHDNFDILDKTNEELNKLVDCMYANKLIINCDKTNVMYFQ